MGFLKAAGLGMAMVIAIQGYAEEPRPRLQFGGFGTLGVAATDSHRVEYPRDVSQPTGAIDQPSLKEDSRLGLQLSMNLTDTLFGTLQVLSKYRYDGTFSPDLTWAALTWNPVSNLQVRAGRMTFELFENGMNRDVGYSYLWVRPPTEVFGHIAVSGIDGMDVAQTFNLGTKATLTVKAFGGQSVGKIPIWQAAGPMNFSGGHVLGTLVSFHSGPWRVRLTAVQLEIPNEFPAPASLIPGGFDAYSSLLADPRLAQSGSLFRVKDAKEKGFAGGVLYEKGPVQAEGFFLRNYADRFLLPATNSGYLSLGYRLGDVVPYAVYARTLSERREVPYLGAIPILPDPNSKQFNSGINTAVQALNVDQYTWSAGLRWDFAENAAFKLQVDQVHIPNPSSTLYVVEPGFKGRLTVISAVVDFVFGGGR